MNFDHPSVNKFFGFGDEHRIPFICIDNPLVFAIRAQEKFKSYGNNDDWDETEIDDLKKQFESAAESLGKFFKTLEKFPLVLTHQFRDLYNAKSNVEAVVLDAQHKITLLEQEKEKYDLAKMQMQKLTSDG